MATAQQKLIGKSSAGLTYAGEYSNGHLAAKMGHLACFTGGMFALTSMQIDSLTSSERQTYKQLAIDITNTCHESYIRTATQIGIYFNFDANLK